MTNEFEEFWNQWVSPDELGVRFMAERAWLAGKEQAYKWADEAYQRKLDALGLAISNAGYVWTPEMRAAYEAQPFDGWPVIGAKDVTAT